MTSMKKPPTVGIIGGGQLSRMLCLAATQLGIPTATLERKQNCPAATVSDANVSDHFGRHIFKMKTAASAWSIAGGEESHATDA